METRSSGSARIFSLNRAAILDRLRHAQELAARCPEVEEVRLFGSLARGDARPGSDADILVVLGDSPIPFHERIPRYGLGPCGIGIDLLPYTRAELAELPRRSPRFAAELRADAVTLYRHE